MSDNMGTIFKKITGIALLITCGITFSSCLDEDEDKLYESEFGSYSTLGTIIRTDEPLIDSDTYGLLAPVGATFPLNEKTDSIGQRLLLEFNFAEKNPLIYADSIQPIQVVHIYNVLTKPATDLRNASENHPDLSPYGNDPIQVNTVSISKSHLNIQFYVMGYHTDIVHRVSLLLTDESRMDEEGLLSLDLRHNAEGDKQEELFWGVVSFNLSSIPEYGQPSFKGFRIRYTDLNSIPSETIVTLSSPDMPSRTAGYVRPLLSAK